MDFEKFVTDDIADVEKEIGKIIPREPEGVYDMLGGYIFRGGKRIRPSMFMLAFRALGGKDRKAALKTAALLEMFHNFTLIHDDIEDNSQFRRGKPTLHISHGIPIALNSGDAIYTVVWNNILALELPAEKRIRLASIMGRAFQRVVEGQGVELDWYKARKIGVSEEEYFSMVGGKTGALMGAACEAGAYLAGADPKAAEEFGAFGESLGVAFQIQDDVLNVTGDFEKYKKEIGGDITEGKRTLMVIHAMAHASADECRKLSQILSSNSADKGKIGYVISLFRKYDSISYAKIRARTFVEDTSAFLESLPQSKEKNELKKLSDYVINREL